jgi:hypothetical protein
MAYQEALEAAGATVVAFQEFGSYQGTWMARLADGRFVTGSYGSCSGCDAFEAEFGYSERETCDEHRYVDAPADCEACKVAKDAYQAKLAAFGASYLEGFATRDELIAEYTKRRDSERYFSSEDQEVLTWLQALPA